MRRIAALVLLVAALATGQGQELPAFRVAGSVVDADGKAVRGALVSLWDALAPARFLAKGKTDAKGGFSIEVAEETARRREHPFGSVIVAVQAEGMAQRRADAQAGADAVRISTVPARPISGVVETADGVPLPAAVVIARDGGVVQKTTSDENGRYVLDQFGAGQAPRIEVVGEGYLLRVRDPARVRMPRVRLVAGRIVDADSDAPIAGAKIQDGARVAAVTDAEGRYVLPVPDAVKDVEPARYRVHAQGYESAWIEHAPAGSADSLTRVAGVEPLRGRVVDGKGASVSGARVSIGRDFVAWTDALGGFSFDTLPRGMVDLEAAKPGFLPARVRLEAGVVADRITLQLAAGERYDGRVMRAGKPAMGVRVAALDGDREAAVAFTDAKGRYELRGVPPAARRILASEPGRRSAFANAKAGLTLDLEEQMRLAGRLRSDTGDPLAEVPLACAGREATTNREGRFDFGNLPVRAYVVEAAPANHEPVRAELWPGDARDLVATSRFGDLSLRFEVVAGGNARATVRLARRDPPRVRRSANGSEVSFGGLAAGRYEYVVQAEGHLDRTGAVDLRSDRVLRVELERGGTLRLDATPGAKVIVQTLSGRPAPIVVMVLAKGKKSVHGFGPGEYRFIARAPGELIVVRNVRLGPKAPPLDLDLRGGKESVLTVTVRDRTGDPVVGAKLTLESAAGFVSPQRWTTDESGKARLDRLFAGSVTLTALKGERRAGKRIDVAPGKELDLELVLGG